MLVVAHTISFLGMILLPIVLWIYFTRKFSLSWKLVIAGGLTFIASQIPHIPLLRVLAPTMKGFPLLVNAVILGLLAGIFEETARYILFKWILKRSRSWKEGVLVGLGHGGTEALILGVLAALTFANMLVYRNIDLSTIPSIPADQLELAKQQVATYWSIPWYVAVLPFIERIFAICLHVSLSLMVLYSIAARRPLWFWLALLWHALVDAVAVYAGSKLTAYISPNVVPLALEGIVAIFALISLGVIFWMRSRFPAVTPDRPRPETTAA